MWQLFRTVYSKIRIWCSSTLFYWASIFFNSCIHLQVINVVIYDPIGYAIVGHNVIGNSSLESFEVIITKEYLYTLLSIACSLAIHWSYDGSDMN